MKMAVLNASNPINVTKESDSYVDYRDGIESCFSGNKEVKKCRSFHSLAVAAQGEFFVYNKPGWQGVFKYENIIILVKDTPKAVLPLIKQLKKAGKRVLVGFHENGDYLSQIIISQPSPDEFWLSHFAELVEESDGLYSIMPSKESIFEWFFNKPVFSTLHAAPYDEWRHNFSVPRKDRKGLFLATRTFNQFLRRNTFEGLMIAMTAMSKINNEKNDTEDHVTVVCEDSFHFDRIFSFFRHKNVPLDVVKGPLPYEDWLKLIAKHKMVFQFDYSNTLGQVAMDAALVDVPCIGSNTEVSRAAITDTLYDADTNLEYLTDYFGRPESSYVVKRVKEKTSFDVLRRDLKLIFGE